MKVVHVIKQIEMIDNDVKELKKLEKTIARDKSFSTPIYMSIEKQINILLGQRIKLLELKIENPPAELVSKVTGEDNSKDVEAKKTEPKRTGTVERKVEKKNRRVKIEDLDDDDIPMLTQDDIDAKFSSEVEKKEGKKRVVKVESKNESVKILDLALENGDISKNAVQKEKEKKVRFFRENFPSE